MGHFLTEIFDFLVIYGPLELKYHIIGPSKTEKNAQSLSKQL